jgi:hypothetical protein
MNCLSRPLAWKSADSEIENVLLKEEIIRATVMLEEAKDQIDQGQEKLAQ